MNHPIIQRELLTVLRSRKALAMQVLPAAVFALLVLLRWPTDAQVALSGAQAQEVFRLFGYGLLATLLLLVPAYPATAIVTEKIRGTLTLLFHSELGPWSIYTGKLLGVLGFAFLPLAMSVPAAAACYAMGGIAWGDLLVLYGILALVTVQYAALGLRVSSEARSTDSALRITYGLALLLSVAAVRLARRRWTIIGGATAAVASLAATQGLAIVTGLAHGDAEPTGWRLALVLTMLLLYTVAVVVTAVGGVQLWRDVGRRTVPPGR